MKIGLLADIHGNGDALAAVLHEARARGIEQLLCCGDFVGYYYEPERCLDLLAEWHVTSVRGNHDDMLDELWHNPGRAEDFRKSFGSGLAIAAAVLTPAQRLTLESLPAQRTIAAAGKAILLCHGAPWDASEYVYPEADASMFARCGGLGVDYVVMGHTHCQMTKRAGATVVVNPGSVGQPRRGTPGAEWALLDLETGTVEHATVRYDVGPVVSRARAADPHFPFLWEVLERT